VRYTTARHTAAEAVDRAFAALGTPRAPACRTDVVPLAGGAIPGVATLIADAVRQHPEIPPSALTRLVRTYGTDYARVLALAEREPALAAPLGDRCEVTALELTYAAREEMALTLADALLRRTEAGSAGHPGADAVSRAADVLAAERGWDPNRRQAEIDDVERLYRLPQ
jgi:glycerol-3-phosphate dehydrogenase